MELSSEMKKTMTSIELDKSYIPGQERLPVVAYQIVKNVIGFFVTQHTEIKRLEGEVRNLKRELVCSVRSKP